MAAGAINAASLQQRAWSREFLEDHKSWLVFQGHAAHSIPRKIFKGHGGQFLRKFLERGAA